MLHNNLRLVARCCLSHAKLFLYTEWKAVNIVFSANFSRYLLAQQDLVIYREKASKQQQQITDLELEIQLLRKQLEGLETERERDRKTIENLEELLRTTRLVNKTLCALCWWPSNLNSFNQFLIWYRSFWGYFILLYIIESELWTKLWLKKC